MKYMHNGKWKTVSPPCTCGGCERCYPQDPDRDEAFCVECDTMTPHLIDDLTVCDECNKTYGTVTAVFTKNLIFCHVTDDAPPVDAVKCYLDTIGRDWDEDTIDATAERFIVVDVEPLEGWQDWTTANQPPGGVMSQALDDTPWVDGVFAANPILGTPRFKSDCARWRRVRDAVERAYPELDMTTQGGIVGKILQRIQKGGAA